MLRALRILLVLCLASPVFAQEANVVSLVPSATYEADAINLQTLTPLISVPVRSKGGPIPFSAAVNMASGCLPNGANGDWECSPNIGAISSPSNPGVSVGNLQFIVGASTISGPTGTCTGVGGIYQYSNWYIGDVSGNVWHPLTGSFSINGSCDTSTYTQTTIDGSGLTVALTANWNSATTTETLAATITDKFGNVQNIPSATWSYHNNPPSGSANHVTDAFSNQVSGGANGPWAEPLNPTGHVLSEDGSGGFTYTDATGTSQSITATFNSTQTLKTNFSCTGIGEESGTFPGFIDHYTFPDGSTESFGYESITGGITGRISSITLRTGGQVQYTYGAMNCTDKRPLSLTRVGADGTTTFTVVVSGTNNGSTTTVLDPGKNKTVYTFTGYTISTATKNPPSLTNVPALTKVERYQNTGTIGSPTNALLTTDVYCYNGNTTSCSSAAVSYPITEIQVTHTINGMSNSSKTVTMIDGGPTGGCAGGTANCYGNVTEYDVYDFGASTPTEKTITAYGSTSGSGGSTTCTSVGSSIFGKPCYVQTQMGSNTVAFTNYKYNSTGAPTDRYDLTTGSTYLHTSYSPNSNGTVGSVTSPSGATVSYSYSTSTGCPSSGSGLLPTGTSVTVVTGDTLTTSTSYECNGGTVTGTTDENSNSSTIAFNDSLYRLSSVADPYSFTYTPCYGTLSGGTCTASATSVSGSSGTFNSGNSQILSNNVVDTFGRPITSQVGQGPSSSNFDTVSLSYGWGGTNSTNRMVSTSAPCTALSGANCSSYPHSTQFDPLGRPINSSTISFETITTTYTQNDVLADLSPHPTGENDKQVQTEYDALGRVKSTCAISSTVSGNALCNQATNTTAKGILTTMAYSSAAGSQTITATRGSESRTATSDALGRITSESYPETAGVAFTNTYDATATATCSWTTTPNLAGHLSLAKDPNGNNLCYSYDAIGRLVQVNANGTNCRHYYYDNSTGYSGTIPTGITVSNNLGQMVEAATDTCASNTLKVDEWFSYDKDGRQTDVWELTPVKSTYYHTSITYWPNSAPNTITIPVPPSSTATVTYTPDGEGRWNAATLGTTTLISGVTYDNSDSPTNVAIGSGTDADAFSYDTNENMKQFQHTVGSANSKGVLTWNGNNTLGSLAITDGFNSNNTQTCAMSYDDLSRLVGDNCGTVWAQTYSYDQYDNLNKSGSASWSAMYNTNNQYAGISATYDSNGNLTYDGTTHFTWDPFGKMASEGGTSITYDAFGRPVAISNKEITYSALGETAVMNSGSLYGTYIPMPGGGSLWYDGSIKYLHLDWLGSARTRSSIPSSGNGTEDMDAAFSPYGDRYNATGGGAANGPVFAGITSEMTGTLMYDTPNRELTSNASRWASPDPARSGWNLYAYTTNPNSFTDPSGLCEDYDVGCENGQLVSSNASLVFNGSGGGGETGSAAEGSRITGAAPTTTEEVGSLLGNAVGTLVEVATEVVDQAYDNLNNIWSSMAKSPTQFWHNFAHGGCTAGQACSLIGETQLPGAKGPTIGSLADVSPIEASIIEKYMEARPQLLIPRRAMGMCGHSCWEVYDVFGKTAEMGEPIAFYTNLNPEGTGVQLNVHGPFGGTTPNNPLPSVYDARLPGPIPGKGRLNFHAVIPLKSGWLWDPTAAQYMVEDLPLIWKP